MTLCFSFAGISQGSHFNTKIGTVTNTGTTLTMSPTLVFSKMEAHLAANNVMVNLSKYSFTHVSGSVYNLVVQNQNESISIALELILDDGNLYEARISGSGHTVTCSGCRVGCHPQIYEGVGSCTACLVDETCTKTESVSTGAAVL